MPSFTRESGGTLHVVGVGVNRIGKEYSCVIVDSREVNAAAFWRVLVLLSFRSNRHLCVTQASYTQQHARQNDRAVSLFIILTPGKAGINLPNK